MKFPKTALFLSMMAVGMTAQAGNDWKDTANDAWLDGKAETTLMLNSNLNSFAINTDVRNGTVVLTGKVDSETDKALAEELIASIEGVKEVDNKLKIVDPITGKDDDLVDDLTDSKIATVLTTKLVFDSNVSASDIDVDVDNGVVTLKGNVATDAERDLAVNIARNTSDVEKVIDELDVTDE